MQKGFLVLAVASCMTFSAAYAQNDSGKKMKAYMVADAHLDTQWNWDIQTTIKHYVRNSQALWIDRFLHSEAWMEKSCFL